MRSLLAATLLISSLPAAAAPLQPLVEVGRVPLEPPFADSAGGPRSVLFHPEVPVGYAVSDDHLFAFDARTGADLGRLFLGPAAGNPGHGGWQLTPLGGRLLAWSYLADGLALVDIDDPAAPKLLDAAPGTWGVLRVVAALDGGRFVLHHDYDRLDVVATEPFRRVASFPHVLSPGRPSWAYASSAARAAPVVAVSERNLFPERRVLAVYEVVEGMPDLRFWREESADVRSVLPDRTGEVLVATFDTYAPVRRSRVETIDARTGATLASWDVGRDVWVALAEGEGRQLLLGDAAGIDVVDLADPGDPRPIGRIESRSWWRPAPERVAPSAIDPVVFVADETKGEIIAVDPRTATEIARLPAAGGVPMRIELQEVAGGTRRGAVIVRRDDGYRTFSRGGLFHVDLADLTNPAAPRATGRFLRNHPRRADSVRAIGDRHVLVYEIERNALALVDLSEGRVAQVTGASGPLGEFTTFDVPELRTAGRLALVAGRAGWERFALVRGRLEPLDARIRAPGSLEGLAAAELTPGGTVIALGWRYDDGMWRYELETTGLDGRRGRIPRVDARLLFLDVSPIGELLAVSRPEFWGERGVDVYDVSDPSSPSLLWTFPGDVNDAVFDPTGTRLLVSGPLEGGSFRVRVFDARTGAPKGPPSAGIAKYFYHGFGAQWIVGGAWRAMYWRWSFEGWENALVELSEPTPSLVRTYTYDLAFPEFAPRDGGGWYEVRRDVWNGRSSLVVGAPGGEIAETGVFPEDHAGITAVKRGFVATARRAGEEFGISLWRDLSVAPPHVPFPRRAEDLGRAAP